VRNEEEFGKGKEERNTLLPIKGRKANYTGRI
jgi:hypothetical protein